MIGSFKFPPPESKLCSNVLPKCRIWWWNCFCKRQHQRPWLSVWLCKPFSRSIHSYRWIIYLQTPLHTNNSFCLALKYVWRLVRGHYLFQDEMYCVLCIVYKIFQILSNARLRTPYWLQRVMISYECSLVQTLCKYVWWIIISDVTQF